MKHVAHVENIPLGRFCNPLELNKECRFLQHTFQKNIRWCALYQEPIEPYGDGSFLKCRTCYMAQRS